MKSLMLGVAVFAIGLAVVGCGKTEGEKPGASAEKTDKAAAGAVTVPDDGKKFEPAIKPEELPAGAWYCDMGTVHYAQMKEGDKTCPLCQMKLKQKP